MEFWKIGLPIFNRSAPGPFEFLGPSSARPVCWWWIGTTLAADFRSWGRRRPMNARRGGRVRGNSQCTMGWTWQHGIVLECILGWIFNLGWTFDDLGWFGIRFWLGTTIFDHIWWCHVPNSEAPMVVRWKSSEPILCDSCRFWSQCWNHVYRSSFPMFSYGSKVFWSLVLTSIFCPDFPIFCQPGDPERAGTSCSGSRLAGHVGRWAASPAFGRHPGGLLLGILGVSCQSWWFAARIQVFFGLNLPTVSLCLVVIICYN